ncbi:MAG TPA: hypothetical protein VFZ76_09565 [Anaerolineales bacterium]
MSPNKDTQKSKRFTDEEKAAVKELTPAVEARIESLVKKAVS